MLGRRSHHEDADAEHTGREPAGPATESARERYGGFSLAAAFYGWLVAVALTVLLAGVTGAAAAATGLGLDVTPGDIEDDVDTLGLSAAIALLVILLIAYVAGGYVAGRMSRFDGGRQGVGVWALGLVVTVLAATLGAVFGTQYDVFAQVDMPSVVTSQTITAGGVIGALVVVVATLLAAMVGGKAGQRYHTKVDRASAF